MTTPDPTPVATAESNGYATAGMVLGIIAAALSIIPIISIIALPVALVGAPLAGVGFARARRVRVGNAQAIAGIALNVVAVLLWIGWAFVWGAAMSDPSAFQ